MCIALFSYFIFYISTIEMTLKKSFLKIMIGITHSDCSDNDRLSLCQHNPEIPSGFYRFLIGAKLFSGKGLSYMEGNFMPLIPRL